MTVDDKTKELVKRLRDAGLAYGMGALPLDAALALEALAGEVAKYKKEWMAEISANIDIATIAAERRVKLEAAEAARDRLKAALVEQVKQYPDYSDICRKALRAAGDGR